MNYGENKLLCTRRQDTAGDVLQAEWKYNYLSLELLDTTWEDKQGN